MLCQHCPAPLLRSNSLRQRITPTFIHHNIFGQNDSYNHLNVRFTPTFASTVMDCQGYQARTHHKSTSRVADSSPRSHLQRSVYLNQTREKKVADLNSGCWFEEGAYGMRELDAKVRVMQEINSMGGRTSHMRKIVEQMSNPVFGSGYFWEPQSSNVPARDVPATSAQEQSLREAKSLQKLKTDRSNEEDESAPNKDKNIKDITKNTSAKAINNPSRSPFQNRAKKQTPKSQNNQGKLLSRYRSAANLGSKASKARPVK